MILTGKTAAFLYVATILTYFSPFGLASSDSEEETSKPSVPSFQIKQDIPLKKPRLASHQFSTLVQQFLIDQREFLSELEAEKTIKVSNRCAGIFRARCSSLEKAQELLKFTQQLYDLIEDKEDRRDQSLSDSDSEDVLDENQIQKNIKIKFKSKKNQLNKKLKF